MNSFIKSLEHGLLLDEPNVFLEWKSTKNDILKKIDNLNIVNENYYTFKTRIKYMPFVNQIGLLFKRQNIIKATLFNDEMLKYSENELIKKFESKQILLENLFGKPNKTCFLVKIFTQDKGSTEFKWKFKFGALVHKLWDRFGMEENLEFRLHIK